MKFDYISDLHVNFHFSKPDRVKPATIHQVYDSVFESKQSDYLLVAGDTAQNPKLACAVLNAIADTYGYKHVYDVAGNHLLYITSTSEKKRYDSSYSKIQFYKDTCVGTKVTILDGDIVDVEGITIGGAMGWYDTSYDDKIFTKHMYGDTNSIYNHWRRTMNDSRYIDRLAGDYKELTHRELTKVEAVLKKRPNIMITHMCPICAEPTELQYKQNRTNTFYMFDGEEYIDQYKPKFWVYGHMHTANIRKVYDTTLVINAHGYPNEGLNCQVKTLEI